MPRNSEYDIFGVDWGQNTYGEKGGSNRQKPGFDDSALSFTKPDKGDGALVVDDYGNGDMGGGGGRAMAAISFQADYRTERDLITLYRKMAQQADVENAIDDIVNETFVMDGVEDPVSIDLDDIDAPDNIKKVIGEEFETILKMMKFYDEGDDRFRDWYIDGRQYHHIIIDSDRPQEGIKEIRQIDPRYIQLIREIHRKRIGRVEVVQGYREYYLYSDPRMGNMNQGLEISPQAICYVHSGKVDAEYSASRQNINNNQYEKEIVISHLHKAIKPYNRLNQLEDALVIYRISRAPERLVFYVDIGNLNKTRAESFMRENMQKYKNKLVYDGKTGKVKNNRHVQSVMENVWLPRKQGSRGTEVSSLTGAMNLGNIDDVSYFKRRLLESLKTPQSRRESDGGMLGTRTTEISRDELTFGKFAKKLANRYSKTFLILLKTQLILKRVCTLEDWERWREDIKFRYATDSYFEELKEQEIWGARFEALQALGIELPVGKYISHNFVRKTILRQTPEEIEEEDKLIKEEENNPQYNQPEEGDGMGGGFGGGFGDDPKPKEPAPKPKPKLIDEE